MLFSFLYVLIVVLIEVRANYHVIAGSDKSIQNHNRAWHKWYAGYAFSIYLYMGLAEHWILMVFALTTRLILFQVVLNRYRGLPYDYLGSKGIDKLCDRYLGRTMTLVIKLAMWITTILYAIFETQIFSSILFHGWNR